MLKVFCTALLQDYNMYKEDNQKIFLFHQRLDPYSVREQTLKPYTLWCINILQNIENKARKEEIDVIPLLRSYIQEYKCVSVISSRCGIGLPEIVEREITLQSHINQALVLLEQYAVEGM